MADNSIVEQDIPLPDTPQEDDTKLVREDNNLPEETPDTVHTRTIPDEKVDNVEESESKPQDEIVAEQEKKEVEEKQVSEETQEQEEEEQEEEQEDEDEEEKPVNVRTIVIKQQHEVPGLITCTFTLLMLVYALKVFFLLCGYTNCCGSNCICLSS